MPRKPSAPPGGRPDIPAYALYGENALGVFPDSVHAETIDARSARLDWKIEPHRHHGLYQAIWISGGGAKLSMEGDALALVPNGFAWIPPLVVHGFAFEPGTTGVVVSIPVPTIAHAFPKSSPLRTGLDSPIVAVADQRARQDAEGVFLFETVLGDYSADHRGRNEGLVLRAALLALWFLRNAERGSETESLPPSADVAIVQRFLAEVEGSYSEHRPMPAYARAVGVSLPHLGRLCRQVTGHSALQILHERILLEAKRNLVYTALPIGEVALRLGFEDAAYFSRFFRERTGTSPQGFRALASKTGDG